MKEKIKMDQISNLIIKVEIISGKNYEIIKVEKRGYIRSVKDKKDLLTNVERRKGLHGNSEKIKKIKKKRLK